MHSEPRSVSIICWYYKSLLEFLSLPMSAILYFIALVCVDVLNLVMEFDSYDRF